MKKCGIICILFFLIVIVSFNGCASDRYQTQKGAAIGAALGAGYGQAIGRDTESTLLGVALGGLTGAIIGNYEDQRNQYERSYRRPAYRENYRTYYSPPRYMRNYEQGQWITVPGQYVGGQYVPPHPAWVPPRDSDGVVVERR